MKKISIIIAAVLTLFALDIVWYCTIPDVAYLIKHNPKKTSFMKFREKQWAKSGRKTTAAVEWVSYGKISKNIITAVIIAEDAKFWSHEGFDFEAIQNALIKDIKAKKFKLGASTITQQLAKNLYLGPSKNPIRKINEAVLTVRLEKTLSKRRLLELYLNVVEWGPGIFGIEKASLYYFKKMAGDLTLQEASRLAAVLPNPNKYNPLSKQRYVVRRSAIILRNMGLLGRNRPGSVKPLPVPKDSIGVEQDSSAVDISNITGETDTTIPPPVADSILNP